MHLSRRTALAVCALALSGALSGCSDDPAAPDPGASEPGGAAPGGTEKNAPDGGEVAPPSGQ